MAAILRFIADHDIVNDLLFPCPPPSYTSSMHHLIWLPERPGGKHVIPALLLKASRGRTSGTGVVVFFHGNGEDIGLAAGEASAYQGIGYHVLVVEYPGYGLYDGKPTPSGLHRVADAAYAFLTEEMGISSEKVRALIAHVSGAYR